MEVLIAAAVVIGALVGALLFAPAEVVMEIDTATRLASGRARLLWGKGPTLAREARPKRNDDFAVFVEGLHSVPRVTRALMTKGIFDQAVRLLSQLYSRRHRNLHVTLSVNLGDPARNFVVLNAARAARALAPEAIRTTFDVVERATPGADVHATLAAKISPVRLALAYVSFKNSTPIKTFTLRLRRPA